MPQFSKVFTRGSKDQSKKFPTDPPELPAPRRSKNSQRSGSHENGSETVSELDSKECQPAKPPRAELEDTAPSTQPQSLLEAQLEISLVEQHIQKAAERRKRNLDSVLKYKGAAVALESLIELYQPAIAAEHDLRVIEEQIRNAPKDINETFMNGGTKGAVKLLIRQHETGLQAEQDLKKLESKIKQAIYEISPRQLEKKGSIESSLKTLIDDYHSKAYSEQRLTRLEEQIKKSKHQLPRGSLETALKMGGAEEGLKTLLNSYETFFESDRELRSVEDELFKAAKSVVAPNEIDETVRRKGIHGGLRLLARTQSDRIDDLHRQLKNLESKYSSLDGERNKLASENQQLKMKQSQQQGVIDNLSGKHRDELDQLGRKHKDQLEEAAERERSLSRRHESDLDRLKAAQASAIKRWEQNLASASKNHKLEVAKIEAEHNDRINSIKDEYENERKENRRKEMARIEEDRIHMEALKGELVKREHFKGLSDPEIYANFKKLVGEVNSFARIPWEKRKEARWPLSENMLNRSTNSRKLKLQIVQSSIWIILNEMIFRSPFKIFGEEGVKMHHDWTEVYGEGDQRSQLPRWPEATEDSEKFRFERIKESLDALKQSINGSDIKQKWKEGHEESIKRTSNQIYEAVETISAVTASDLQTVQGLVKMAAKFWLEVASQKCRILLVFPSHAANALEGGKSLQKGDKLVVQPEVLRMGNAQGQRLDMEQVIKGCEGEHIEFEAR